MGSHFKMNPQSLLIHLFALYSVCYSQITLDDDQEARPVSGEDVDTRLFNINLGTLDLGNVAGTALGTTLGNLGTGFLQDCFGIGKRSIIMDQLVNRRRRNPQEVSDEVPDVDSRIIGEDGVNSRIFCTGGGSGGFGGGYRRPNCRTCNCNYDNRCYNVCDKCYQGGGYGYSANTNSGSGGYSNSNSGSSFGSVAVTMETATVSTVERAGAMIGTAKDLVANVHQEATEVVKNLLTLHPQAIVMPSILAMLKK